MKLQYVGNELKEKDTARPISEIKRSLDKLNQSVSAIQMPPSKQSLCVAISDCDALKRSILNFYDAQNESYDFNARANLFDIDIKSDVNVYKFTLSSRLPARPANNNSGKNFVKYNNNDIFSTCYKAIVPYVENHPIKMQETAVVVFINFYDENEFWIDVDNINYKPFIDACIKNVFVHDDNGKHVSMICLSRKGHSHTEVIVGKEITDVIEYIM
jgi:hypothetical protein